MKVGFTGTQIGMTKRQYLLVRRILHCYYMPHDVNEFHDGDCIGADEQAHRLAEEIGFRMILHPPSNPSKRAFNTADEIRLEKAYLLRNKDIVVETAMLVAAPQTADERLRSGTWSTIRYARDLGKKIIIVTPDGEIK